MLLNPNNRVNKGMVFAGCSFTWGQGLYYYSNLPTLDEPPPDQFDPKMLRRAHVKFMESNRFPRLVANHFGTYEYVFYGNGGSNEGIVDYWKKCFDPTRADGFGDGRIPQHNLKHEEVSWVIFQMTQWQRDMFSFTYKPNPNNLNEYQNYSIPFAKTGEHPWNNMFLEWCSLNNIDLEKFIQNFIRDKVLHRVKQFLQDLENNGIRTAVLIWEHELLSYIENDSWLLDRFITFNYKDNHFKSIEQLMGSEAMYAKPKTNPELTIKWDEEAFLETPKDHHPSLTCHRVIADNVIRHIEARQ